MQRSTAEQVKETVLDLSRKFDQSAEAVMVRCQPELASLYRRLAGRVMGLFFTNVLMPIYREHPALEPPELRTQEKPEKGKLPADLAQELVGLVRELNDKVHEALQIVLASEGAEEMHSLQSQVDEVLKAAKATEMFIRQNSEVS